MSEGLEQIVSTFNQGNQEKADPEVTETVEGKSEAATKETQETAESTETTESTESKQEPKEIFSSSKQNQAFAQLRTENKQYSQVLQRLAKIIGLQDVTDPTQLPDAVENRLREYEAKQMNVPVDLLQKLEAAERAREQQSMAALAQQADLAFERVKETFNLKDAELVKFAQQLNDAGKNPYVSPMDLIAEYKLLNYDALIKQEREKAIQEANSTKEKAAAHSTTPNKAASPGGSKGSGGIPGTDLDSILKGFSRN